MSIKLLSLASLLLISAITQTLGTVTVQQKELRTTTIGSQIWMADNLNVETFRNGDVILHAQSIAQWVEAGEKGIPAWCYFENDTNNSFDFGKLYNWFAVSDDRNLAPVGWHVPNHEEWSILVNNLGGRREAGAKLKAEYGWAIYPRGTNEALFYALPSGTRFPDGMFGEPDRYAYWWTTTQDGNSHAWSRGLNSKTSTIDVESYLKRSGFAVRCIKDTIIQ